MKRPTLGEVPLLNDQKTARQIMLEIAQKKTKIAQRKRADEMFNMPSWMLKSLNPADTTNLSAKQKWYLKQQDLAQQRPDPKAPEHLQVF